MDGARFAGGKSPTPPRNFAVVERNDIDKLDRATAAGGIAAVVMEPVLCKQRLHCPAAGLSWAGQPALRAARHPFLFFDEVITGFRLSLGGAQDYYGFVPDLATFGKAGGGGAPLSGIAGRAKILMQMYDGVTFGGSFNGNSAFLASANATLTELARDNGAALVHEHRMGQRLIDGIPRMARIPVVAWRTSQGIEACIMIRKG